MDSVPLRHRHGLSEKQMSDEARLDDLKRLPLDGWHRTRGARMVPFAGYEMPVQYDGIIAEHEWTRSHASLFDVSHMGQLYIHGDGAEAGLETLLPTDLGTLAPGALRYSLLLTDDGGIVDDLIAARWQSGFYVVVNGATKNGDIAYLRERLHAGVALDHLADRALLALQGPEAFAVLERHVSGQYPLSALTFMRGGQFEIAGTTAWISRTGYTGEDGFEISLPASHAKTLAELLCGEPAVRPAGLGARDSLRLEAGLPLYGHDLSHETDPVSAGLGFAISKRRRAEGGFPGAGRILKLLSEGPGQKLVGLALEGRMAAREHAPVMAGDHSIGEVTSGGFSPTLGHAIALAYVDAGHAAPGTILDAEVRGKRLPARVVPLPFVPHRYHR
ncbi:MAG TPA: glycine cleavage system aminomethyltransferase GcvT [Croceibacterium sp.]|nr:glycine cleavage system aminomethyltransferase GcvT [Croceibacterium sp.]